MNNYEVIEFKNGNIELSVNVSPNEDTVWLTQKQMSILYDTSVDNVSLHIKNIFKDLELDNSVVEETSVTASDGKNYNTKHYNLQAIIAVGFKINNPRAVQFRKWAGQIVKDYTIQGWVMDKERLIKGHMY